ncbi:MAG: S8 family peptidase [Erysipelotrichales bacterium]|nr:S8 family peptidase [Erysipelotrichales bacterium]
MNPILHLKGPFEQRSRVSNFGPPQLAKYANVSLEHLNNLKKDLERAIHFWRQQFLLPKTLVSVYYTKVVAKSNRISGLLSKSPNDAIVGAKFKNDEKKHIITYYVSIQELEESVVLLEKAINILESEFNGEISRDVFNNRESFVGIDFVKYNIAQSNFQKVIVDASYVEKIDIESNQFSLRRDSIITLYKTGKNIKDLLEKMGIRIYSDKILDETSVLLDLNQLEILMQKAPYLIAMATEDISLWNPTDFIESAKNKIDLPSPLTEPVIGVIDTHFDQNVYFNEWVEYHNMLNPEIPLEPQDFSHGTAVSSIIVDGPRLNPWLEDGCGRFRVRHFGVATQKRFSSFSIIRLIKEIVAKNKDIRVWNLSLGSNEEVHQNFISAEAAVLDQIQFENDVIFVIAGTNKNPLEKEKRLGSPADSVNAIVVNSVDISNNPADYTRKGPVLSFFPKPDISYYGGSASCSIIVCKPLGEAAVSGTSFAAPWIARKVSYLIDILGFNREIAKAMLIDSAIGWEENIINKDIIGHGIVPININDIVSTKANEIKFVISGVSEKYDTYNYNFPVPLYEGKYPFIAKATMCYFPRCSRSQGVDYTNTELDLYFGRIKKDGKLDSIDKNKQSLSDEDSHPILEEVARKYFRKWDNIKHIQDKLRTKVMPKKVLSENKLWGMSIKTKERLNKRDGEGIRFGVVVTLKEINGVNRIEDFIQLCSLKGWLVNKINIETQIDIYNKASEDVIFD